jgi:hypothetical protein
MSISESWKSLKSSVAAEIKKRGLADESVMRSGGCWGSLWSLDDFASAIAGMIVSESFDGWRAPKEYARAARHARVAAQLMRKACTELASANPSYCQG